MSVGNRVTQFGICMLIFSKSPLGTNLTMNGFISIVQQSHKRPKTQNRGVIRKACRENGSGDTRSAPLAANQKARCCRMPQLPCGQQSKFQKSHFQHRFQPILLACHYRDIFPFQRLGNQASKEPELTNSEAAILTRQNSFLLILPPSPIWLE